MRARPVDAGDATAILDLLVAHAAEGSRLAASITDAWDAWAGRFLAVEPADAAGGVSLDPPLAAAR